jgi:hypothetical protein
MKAAAISDRKRQADGIATVLAAREGNRLLDVRRDSFPLRFAVICETNPDK